MRPILDEPPAETAKKKKTVSKIANENELREKMRAHSMQRATRPALELAAPSPVQWKSSGECYNCEKRQLS